MVSNLRRVPTSRILLAEMAEARRRASEKLKGLEASGETVCERACEAVQEFLDQLTENCQELEQAMAERVEMSKATVARWRRETRELVVRLSLLTPQPA